MPGPVTNDTALDVLADFIKDWSEMERAELGKYPRELHLSVGHVLRGLYCLRCRVEVAP